MQWRAAVDCAVRAGGGEGGALAEAGARAAGGRGAPPRRPARAAAGGSPWAVKSLSADIYLNVFNNSYDRMYI